MFEDMMTSFQNDYQEEINKIQKTFDSKLQDMLEKYKSMAGEEVDEEDIEFDTAEF